MEDNNYKHEEFDDCFLCKHPALKHVLIGLLVFLGAFAAFYVVSDWHFKRMMNPMIQMQRMDRALMQQEHLFDKMEHKALQRQQWIDKKALRMQEKIDKKDAQIFHIEKNENAYKIIIDLRPFDNNEKNVEIKTQGNTLIINAAGEKNTHHKQEIVKYSQMYAFGDDADLDEITKIKDGDKYIITIPID